MQCYHPIKAWRSRQGRNANGNWPIVFNKNEGYKDLEFDLPCGGCIGCRLEKSRQWATRIMFEADSHKCNSFVTLTYEDKYLPEDLSLDKKEVQKFLKRLRKGIYNDTGNLVRYYLAGEYGEKYARPHYHMCLFGHGFPDKEYFDFTETGFKVYTSERLQKAWPFGYSSTADLTFESAAYVARYCTKKITGEQAEDHYRGRTPEFALMSRKPGIGRMWYEKYRDDVYNDDHIVIRSDKKCRPPRYYDNILKEEDLPRYQKIKRKRKERVNEEENTYDRLIVKEKITHIKLKKLKRS